MSKIRVISPERDDLIVGHATPEQAARMLRLGTAERIFGNSREIRLKKPTALSLHPCRTYTSRGGVMAVIGRSQVYTVADARGRVTGFKSIFPEDRHVFQAAALGLDV